MPPPALRRAAALVTFSAALCVPATTTVAQAAMAGPAGGLALAHVHVVDPRTGAVRDDQTIVTRGDRIVAVAPSGVARLPGGVRVVNADGAYVIPGLWDAHVHLSYAGACALPVFVAHGVTSVRDLGARLDEVHAWRAAAARGALVTPRIWAAGPDVESAAWLDAAHALAPPTDSMWAWGPRLRMQGPADAAAITDSLARLGVDVVKFRNLPRASFLALAAAARRRGLRLAGHAPKGTTLAQAAAAGLGSVEHAETVTLALGNAPDSVRAAQFRAAARAGLLVTPTLVTERTLWLTPDRVARAVLADSAGTGDPERRYVSPRQLRAWAHALELNARGADGSTDWPALYRRQTADMRLAHRTGMVFLAGTDFGSAPGLYAGAGLQEELALLVRDVGLTPREALASATTAPATFFGQARGFGLTPGAHADLVVLAANPLADIRNTRRIRAVLLGGRLFERAELDGLLGGVAAAVRGGGDCARASAPGSTSAAGR